jgi:hypothetical protein
MEGESGFRPRAFHFGKINYTARLCKTPIRIGSVLVDTLLHMLCPGFIARPGNRLT